MVQVHTSPVTAVKIGTTGKVPLRAGPQVSGAKDGRGALYVLPGAKRCPAEPELGGPFPPYPAYKQPVQTGGASSSLLSTETGHRRTPAKSAETGNQKGPGNSPDPLA